MGRGPRSFHAVSGGTTFLASQCVHQPGSSTNPVVYWGFMAVLLHKHDHLNYGHLWSPVIENNL